MISRDKAKAQLDIFVQDLQNRQGSPQQIAASLTQAQMQQIILALIMSLYGSDGGDQ